MTDVYDNEDVTQEEGPQVELIDNVTDLDERRRLAAIELASRANPQSIEELLDGATKIADYLKSGSMNTLKGPEGTNPPLNVSE